MSKSGGSGSRRQLQEAGFQATRRKTHPEEGATLHAAKSQQNQDSQHTYQACTVHDTGEHEGLHGCYTAGQVPSNKLALSYKGSQHPAVGSRRTAHSTQQTKVCQTSVPCIRSGFAVCLPAVCRVCDALSVLSQDRTASHGAWPCYQAGLSHASAYVRPVVGGRDKS